MLDWLRAFALVFVPIFIVVDAMGSVPFVISMTEGMDRNQKRRVINLATLTATILGLIFLLLGSSILSFLGITFGSFAIAGGIILLVLSIRQMITGHFIEASREETMAVVPIGTPLVVGPATITTLLLLTTQHSLYLVILGFAINMLIVWLVFLVGEAIIGFLGQGGIRALSKVFSLLLAAIAVNLMVQGLSLLKIIKLAL